MSGRKAFLVYCLINVKMRRKRGDGEGKKRGDGEEKMMRRKRQVRRGE